MNLINPELNRRLQKLIQRARKIHAAEEWIGDRDSVRLQWIERMLPLEGVEISPAILYSLLEEGRVPEKMTLSELILALNLNDAFRLIQNRALEKEEMDESFLLHLHRLLVRNLSDVHAGVYRKIAGRKKAGFLPPAPGYIPLLIRDLCEWVEKYRNRMDIQELAFWAHHRILFIRPFASGTEQLARLVLNFVLLSGGLPPMTIPVSKRKLYEHYNHEANLDRYTEYMTFLGELLEEDLEEYLEGHRGSEKTDRESEEPEDWITLNRAEQISGISRDRLSREIRRGNLDGIKQNRIWLTTEKKLAAFLEKRQSINP